MNQRPSAIAFVLLLAVVSVLPACDGTSNLTEQEHIQRAKDFEDGGKLNGSIVELKNAIQKNPNSPQARLLLGQVYLKVGMGAEAEKELSKAEKLGVNRETIKPHLGEALLLMGEYKRILDEIYPGVQTSNANKSRILQLRADALFRQGKVEEACGTFQQSFDTDTGNPPTYWGLSKCAIAGRDMAKARKWLNAALQIKEQQARTWVFIGDWEQINKDFPRAMEAYANALKLEPNNLEALHNRATLSMSQGQLDNASKDVERIRQLAPKSLAATYLQAMLSFQHKKYPEARDALHDVFKMTTNHMPSVLLAGTTDYALGSYQQAETHLNRFLARFPGQVFARRMLAATQIKLSKPGHALETLAPLIAPDSRDAQSLALASDAYRAQNEHAKAAELLQRAAIIDPKNASIQTQLGITYLTTGDTSLAITELEAAAALDTDQFKAESLLAQTYLNRREYDKALTAIAAMEKKLPDSAVAHSMRGSAYLGKNDPANARKSFERALEVDPLFFQAAASLAQLDVLDKNQEAARKRFERILEKEKNHLQAMMALAGLAASQNQHDKYVEWLEKAVKGHPNAIPPYTALTRYYLAKRDSRKALAMANEAVNTNPDNHEALKLLGDTQTTLGDKAGAISTFIRLAQKADQSPDAFLQLALAQIADKKLKDARSSLQKALQRQPNHIPSQETLIRLEMTENKPDAALHIARQMQAQQPRSSLGYDREGDLQLAIGQVPLAIKAYQQALDKGAGSPGFVKLFRAQVIDNARLAEQRLNDWLAQHPHDSAVRAYAAEYYMQNGRNKEAIAHYQEVNRQVPNRAILLNNLANLYQRENDGRALGTAEQAFKLAPDNPAVQDTLGWILVERGQAQRGLELLNKAVSKAPKSASMRYHQAVALARTGNKSGARKVLEKLLSDTQKFPDADAAKALLKSL
jgi:putative PEP-CTERM system TPR-repeat lipoprotein